MIDVTGLKDLKVGDEAVLIGREGKEEISAQELADECRTIAYEIVCSASKCADRFYKG
jgi:alanine racemase